MLATFGHGLSDHPNSFTFVNKQTILTSADNLDSPLLARIRSIQRATLILQPAANNLPALQQSCKSENDEKIRFGLFYASQEYVFAEKTSRSTSIVNLLQGKEYSKLIPKGNYPYDFCASGRNL